MPAYYNEIDPHAAQWLRNLIAAGHIVPGDVDERSIVEVQPDDLRGYQQCHFFAGIGGWSYALRLAGIPNDRPVWTGSCPCQPFSTAGKQRGCEDDRHLWPTFFRLIRECRPASIFGEQVAGVNGLAWIDHVFADLEDEDYAVGAADLPACGAGAPHRRQRLFWMAQAVDNTAGTRHIGTFAETEVDSRDKARLCVSGAGSTDSPVANANSEDNSGRRIQRHREGDSALHGATCERFTGFCSDGSMADPNSKGLEGWSNDAPEYASQRAVRPSSPWSQLEWLTCSDGKSRPTQPGIFPLVDGISKSVVRGGDRSMAPDANQSAEARTMRLKGYGNAIVPQVAALFITAAMQSL
jgi:DNA (cytosine-5)-methyltransferase 1